MGSIHHFINIYWPVSLFIIQLQTFGNFVIFAANNGPIVQWIEYKIPVLAIWVRIPVGSPKRGFYQK